MEFRTLRYVVAVADRLSFTGAARDLNVSQPALSQQIRQLEDELGIQLFARTSHRVSLTQGGLLVVDHARRTLDSVGRIREAVDALQGLKRGRLRLAVTQSFNALHLTTALATFLQMHPLIDVTVLEWSNMAIVAGVADGSLDMGVAFGTIDAPVAARILYKDQLMLTCAHDHPFALLPIVPAHLLTDEAIAMLTVEFGTRRALDRFFEEREITPRRVIELDTFASILKLVETGICVSVMPGLAVNTPQESSSVVFRQLDPAPPIRDVQLLMPPTAAQSPAAKAFGKTLLDQFKSGNL